MNTVNLTKTGVFRGVICPYFFFAILLYALMLFVTVYTDFQFCNPQITPVYYFIKLAYISSTQGFVLVFSSLPSILRYCDDYNSGRLPFIMLRSNTKSYVVSMFASNAVIVLITTFFSEIIFLLVLNTKFPWNVGLNYTTENFMQTSANSYLLITHSEAVFYLAHIMQKAAINILFSSISIFISFYIPNKLFVAVTPLFVYTIISNFLPNLGMPEFLTPNFIYGERNTLFYLLVGTPNAELLSTFIPHVLTIICVSVMCFGSCLIFKKKVKGDGIL